MARYDIEVVKGTGGAEVEFDVASGAAASIKVGEPVVRSTTTDYVALAADGDPTSATGTVLVGIATADSTDTVAAAGKVKVLMVIPGQTILRLKAHTPANIDTEAKLLAYMMNCVELGGTTDWTVNEDGTDDPDVHGLLIIGGDIVKGTIDVMVKSYATIVGCSY